MGTAEQRVEHPNLSHDSFLHKLLLREYCSSFEHPTAPSRIDRFAIARLPVSDVLIGEWKSYPRYRLHRSLRAVQLSTPNGVPTLVELSAGKIVHLIGENAEPGSVQVVCDDGQTYQVFLEDLRDRAESIDDPVT
jgi:hypothetical protein